MESMWDTPLRKKINELWARKCSLNATWGAPLHDFELSIIKCGGSRGSETESSSLYPHPRGELLITATPQGKP